MAQSGFLLLALFCSAAGVEECPGEGMRYGDHKCNHDYTHRVCAQLLDEDGKILSWGPHGNFWDITGQSDFKWDAQIRANHGDSWCICMWATADLIEEVGCDNVHLHCDSTDVSYVLRHYEDGGYDLSEAHACLRKKCITAGQETSVASRFSKQFGDSTLATCFLAGAAAFGLTFVGLKRYFAAAATSTEEPPAFVRL